MKKLISLTLVFVLLLSLSITAFATNETENYISTLGKYDIKYSVFDTVATQKSEGIYEASFKTRITFDKEDWISNGKFLSVASIMLTLTPASTNSDATFATQQLFSDNLTSVPASCARHLSYTDFMTDESAAGVFKIRESYTAELFADGPQSDEYGNLYYEWTYTLSNIHAQPGDIFTVQATAYKNNAGEYQLAYGDNAGDVTDYFGPANVYDGKGYIYIPTSSAGDDDNHDETIPTKTYEETNKSLGRYDIAYSISDILTTRKAEGIYDTTFKMRISFDSKDALKNGRYLSVASIMLTLTPASTNNSKPAYATQQIFSDNLTSNPATQIRYLNYSDFMTDESTDGVLKIRENYTAELFADGFKIDPYGNLYYELSYTMTNMCAQPGDMFTIQATAYKNNAGAYQLAYDSLFGSITDYTGPSSIYDGKGKICIPSVSAGDDDNPGGTVPKDTAKYPTDALGKYDIAYSISDITTIKRNEGIYDAAFKVRITFDGQDWLNNGRYLSVASLMLTLSPSSTNVGNAAYATQQMFSDNLFSEPKTQVRYLKYSSFMTDESNLGILKIRDNYTAELFGGEPQVDAFGNLYYELIYTMTNINAMPGDVFMIQATAYKNNAGEFQLAYDSNNGNVTDYSGPATVYDGKNSIRIPLSVIYNGNGNTGGNVPRDTHEYAANTEVTVLGNLGTLTRVNAVFIGWSEYECANMIDKFSSLPDNLFIAGDTVSIASSDKTLFAVWAKDANSDGIPDIFQKDDKNGLLVENGKLYLYINNVKQTGWLNVNGKKYYASKIDGEIFTCDKIIGGKLYFWNEETGFTIANGFVETEKGTVCYNAGVQVTGWRHKDGSSITVVDDIYEQYSPNPQELYYFLYSTGLMVTDSSYTIGGFRREFNEDHTVKPLSGMQQKADGCYLYKDGKMVYGWCEFEGNTYYALLSTGKLASMWQQIGDKLYYFYSASSAVPYVLKTSGSIGQINYSYDASDGHVLATGFLNPAFAVQKSNNTAPYIYKINETTCYYVDGVAQYGWQKISDDWFYFYIKGTSQSGNLCIENKTINGVYCEFTKNGVCIIGAPSD